MLKIRIIPCLDVDKGRVVKGVNFIGLKDAGDPVEQAKIYSQSGADEITFLDITATNEKRNPMIEIIKKTANQCFVPLTVGGGIKNPSDMLKFLSVGADKISINSSAIRNPELIKDGARKFGNQCIVVAIDAKKVGSQWNVFINGGRIDTKMNAIDWAIKAESLGAGEILLTSMDKDGTKSGFDIDLLAKVSEFLTIPLIASGGVGKLEHFYEGVTKGKADALLAASVFHFNQISIKKVKDYLLKKNIEIRL